MPAELPATWPFWLALLVVLVVALIYFAAAWLMLMLYRRVTRQNQRLQLQLYETHTRLQALEQRKGFAFRLKRENRN